MPYSKEIVEEAKKSFYYYFPNYKCRSGRGEKKQKYIRKFNEKTISFLKENWTNKDLKIAFKKAHKSLKS